MTGWHKVHTLKDYLVRAKINSKDTKESKSARYNGKRCQVPQYIEETREFEDADGIKYDIRKGVINCNTDFTVQKISLNYFIDQGKKELLQITLRCSNTYKK